jgi:hypothetical protein
VRVFKLGQSTTKSIILRIGNFGRILPVIERIMVLDFRRQPRNLSFGSFRAPLGSASRLGNAIISFLGHRRWECTAEKTKRGGLSLPRHLI